MALQKGTLLLMDLAPIGIAVAVSLISKIPHGPSQLPLARIGPSTIGH